MSANAVKSELTFCYEDLHIVTASYERRRSCNVSQNRKLRNKIAFLKERKLIRSPPFQFLRNKLPKCLKHIGKAASEQSFLNRFTGFASSVPSTRLVDIETQ